MSELNRKRENNSRHFRELLFFEECQQINNCEIRFRHDSCPGMHLHKAFDAKIITKYYSASVIVQALVVEPSMALGEDMLESCEAVVCIHTAKNITDLEHTKRLLSVAKKIISIQKFLPSLTLTNQKQKDELSRDSLSTWCFDNKVECVATNMNKLEDGRSNREKHGLARVCVLRDNHVVQHGTTRKSRQVKRWAFVTA